MYDNHKKDFLKYNARKLAHKQDVSIGCLNWSIRHLNTIVYLIQVIAYNNIVYQMDESFCFKP